MGTWGYNIDESDSFADVYEHFFDEYNEGATPEAATASVRTELGEYFAEREDRHDACFALALAQWETKSLEQSLLQKVEGFIESGADLRSWEDRGADSKTIEKRAAALAAFLKKLKGPRKSKKRRRRPEKIDSRTEILVELRAPDDRKTFTISEHYMDDEYQHTQAFMRWAGGGGSVFVCRQPGLKFSAGWIDSQNLKVIMPKAIEDELREGARRFAHKTFDRAYFCGDDVRLHCEFV